MDIAVLGNVRECETLDEVLQEYIRSTTSLEGIDIDREVEELTREVLRTIDLGGVPFNEVRRTVKGLRSTIEELMDEVKTLKDENERLRKELDLCERQ